MNEGPRYYSDVETCVEETLGRIGRRVILGTPLGLGKANHLVNEFFRRACEDSRINLHLFTALSLGRPQWKGELERRFLEPLSERLFAGYPELEYVDSVRQGKLPENIRVSEFYFQPGSFLDSPLAQQSYMSSNYTHVVRDILDAGINVLVQLVSKIEERGPTRYSLSCNPDLTLDLVPRLREAERQGTKIALLAQVNNNLPFMYGDASVAGNYFDGIIDNAKYAFPLFGTPNRSVDTAEYLIALHVSALIRDGGTIQIGIGALEDAVTYLLKLRHGQSDLYNEILTKVGVFERFGNVIEQLGGTGPFKQGLYASSEMLVDGFLELYRNGILRRKVYQHSGLQRLLNNDRIGETVMPATLDVLLEAGVISAALTAQDFIFLQRFGVLRPDLSYDEGFILLKNGIRISANLSDESAKGEIVKRCLGTQLKGGHFAHACFFLGPRNFYESLRQMSPSEREQICMTGISYVNELFGQEELKRLQRKAARFVNTGLIVTLSGAVASDGLEDGRVLSGVGGQYNFVAMAHALKDGRSIMMIRSTSEKDGKLSSNIRWGYGQVTIPRHLRDIVVTEYGIANLRGRSDEEVIVGLVEIADSRFQDELLQSAKYAGKVRQDYCIPDDARNNRPERLKQMLAQYRERGLFAEFPFGTDLTKEEVVLRKALRALDQTIKGKKLHLPRLTEIRKTAVIPQQAHQYLERMQLDRPHSVKERLLQRAVAYALASVNAI
jgi:acyl-CoA hydrolase